MWSNKEIELLSIKELVEKIKVEKHLIEGITLLGGEPLDQFDELLDLLIETRKIGLSAMVFTGYEMDEIIERKLTSLLNNTDILITGRYEQKKRTLNHQWIGSTNQEIHFLTERYKSYTSVNANYVEVVIDEYGTLTYLGFPSKNLQLH